MALLFLVSLVWAFSFGLTKGQLAGLDSAFISAARLLLALIVFLPFLRIRGVRAGTALALTGIGAVQFGVMYLAYNASFRYLQAYEVALLTLTTPVFVTLFADALDRQLRPRALAAAVVAVVGTVVITATSADINLALGGVLLVQLSNLAFAIGQILYQRLRHRQPGLRDRAVFGFLYLGAFLTTLVALFAGGKSLSVTLNGAQALTLLYLGTLASGVCFFLWNVGATRVRAATLAVMNNVKIPLAVAVSLLFFGERADVTRLLLGGALLATAVWMAEKKT